MNSLGWILFFHAHRALLHPPPPTFVRAIFSRAHYCERFFVCVLLLYPNTYLFNFNLVWFKAQSVKFEHSFTNNKRL